MPGVRGRSRSTKTQKADANEQNAIWHVESIALYGKSSLRM